jgi:hypothetical protein
VWVMGILAEAEGAAQRAKLLSQRSSRLAREYTSRVAVIKV